MLKFTLKVLIFFTVAAAAAGVHPQEQGGKDFSFVKAGFSSDPQEIQVSGSMLAVVHDVYESRYTYKQNEKRELLLLDVPPRKKPEIIARTEIPVKCHRMSIYKRNFLFICRDRLAVFTYHQGSESFRQNMFDKKDLRDIYINRDYLFLIDAGFIHIYSLSSLPELKKIRSLQRNRNLKPVYFTEAGSPTAFMFAHYADDAPGSEKYEQSRVAMVDITDIRDFKYSGSAPLSGLCCFFSGLFTGNLFIFHDYEMQKMAAFSVEGDRISSHSVTDTGRFFSVQPAGAAGFILMNNDSESEAVFRVYRFHNSEFQLEKEFKVTVNDYIADYAVAGRKLYLTGAADHLRIIDLH